RLRGLWRWMGVSDGSRCVLWLLVRLTSLSRKNQRRSTMERLSSPSDEIMLAPSEFHQIEKKDSPWSNSFVFSCLGTEDSIAPITGFLNIRFSPSITSEKPVLSALSRLFRYRISISLLVAA